MGAYRNTTGQATAITYHTPDERTATIGPGGVIEFEEGEANSEELHDVCQAAGFTAL